MKDNTGHHYGIWNREVFIAELDRLPAISEENIDKMSKKLKKAFANCREKLSTSEIKVSSLLKMSNSAVAERLAGLSLEELNRLLEELKKETE